MKHKRWVIVIASLLLLALGAYALLLKLEYPLPSGMTDVQSFRWAQESIPYDFYVLTKGAISKESFDHYVAANDFCSVDKLNLDFMDGFGSAPDWWDVPGGNDNAFCTSDSTASDLFMVKYKAGHVYLVNLSF